MNNRGFVFVFVLVLLGVFVAILATPKQTNWTFTYSKYDKNPHGCFVLFEELNEIFPKADITTNDSSFYSLFRNWDKDSSALILINDHESLFDSGEAIDSFVYRGNQVFIASEYIYVNRDDTIYNQPLEMLVSNSGFNDNSFEFFGNKKRDRIHTASLINLSDTLSFNVRGEYASEYLQTDSTFHYKLGIIDDSLNFLRVPFGKGNYYFFSNPGIFTNNAMLYDSLSDYASDILSYLGPDVRHIIWDETTKPGYWYLKQMGEGQQSPLSFIKKTPGLSTAYVLTIIGSLLLIFVRGKRQQQAIPVLEPPQNMSVDFAKTLGRFYHEKHENLDIARKRVHYFETDFKNHYGFPIEEYKDNIKSLSNIMETPESTIIAYFNDKKLLNEVQEITDERLMKISNNIEQMKI